MSLLEVRLSAQSESGRVFIDVINERINQEAQWGEQNHPDGTGGRHHAMRAADAKYFCDRHFGEGKGTWADILNEEFWEVLAESDPAKLRAELIQVAAVAVAWVEAIDRRTR